MSDTPPIRAVIGLPPGDTVRAFEARDTLHATVRWSEMWQEDHARAFTVAKVAKLDMLAEIQASLADVLTNGGTFEQWQANLVPYLRSQGWWGDVADRSLTGTDEVVNVGPRRLRTIFDTNLRTSRAAGRWSRIQELKGTRPFLRYTAVMDARTRPEHRRWHGTILPVDHEWWDTHFPPCGWYCRCTVRQLSQRELNAKGWSVSKVPDDGPPKPFYPAGSTTPVMVPAGISPGFAYNPGKASMEGAAGAAVRAVERAAFGSIPAARATVDELVDSDALPRFLDQADGVFPIAVLDKAGVRHLEAPSPVVVITPGVAGKQGRHHSDLTIADYRQLPTIIHDPLLIVDQADANPQVIVKAIYFRSPDDSDKMYRAVVRTDKGRRYTAVVSFHRVGTRDLASAAKRNTVVLDRREPSA